MNGCSAAEQGMDDLPPVLTSSESECNLQASTCGLRFDEASFASSHNLMSSESARWLFPNNQFPLADALAAGVRGLMIDVHYLWGPETTEEDRRRPTAPHLCHGFCTIGNSLLADSLDVLRRFLEENPRELVVLILEQYVATASVVQALQAAGLDRYLGYGHPGPTATWPTVGELIASGSRLMIFSDKPRTFTGLTFGHVSHIERGEVSGFEAALGLAWWHYMWDFMTETPYDYETLTAMEDDCSFNRGAPASLGALSQQTPGAEAHRLTIMNHFVSNPFADLAVAKRANALGTLRRRTELCRSTWEHQVNFPTVDFWSHGDILEAAFFLNDPH